LLVLTTVVNKGQVQDGICMGHDFTVPRCRLFDEVDVAVGTSASHSIAHASNDAANEARLSSGHTILAVRRDSQVIHHLTRADSVHVMNDDRVAILLVLESLH